MFSRFKKIFMKNKGDAIQIIDANDLINELTDSLLKKNGRLEQENAELRAELCAKEKQKQPLVKLTLIFDGKESDIYLDPNIEIETIFTSEEGTEFVANTLRRIYTVKESPEEVLAAFGIPVE